MENGKQGLVDRSGNTVIPAIYDDIISMANKMWNVRLNDKVGTINADGELLIPCAYKGGLFYPEGGIVVMSEDNSKKKLDYNGIVTDDFVYDYTATLDYCSDEVDKDGNRIQKPANLFINSSNGHLCLINKKGHPITPPIFSSISAYTADLIECQMDSGGEYVMHNEKGERVNN